MKVEVQVWESKVAFSNSDMPYRLYLMDHDDPGQRKVLGMQCRNAFEGGQVIVTYPVYAK